MVVATDPGSVGEPALELDIEDEDENADTFTNRDLVSVELPPGLEGEGRQAWSLDRAFTFAGRYSLSLFAYDRDTGDRGVGAAVVRVIEAPEDPNFWGGGSACAGEGEGSAYGTQWSVSMTRSSGEWTANLLYHDCPGGGRDHYQGGATRITPFRWLATVDLVDARGALGSAANAEYPGPIDYYLISGESPEPNIQREIGTN